MADIHILEGRIQDEDRTVYRYVFHMPTNADAALRARAMLDEAMSLFESVVPGISQTEIDGLRNGSLVEYAGTITYHKADAPSDYLQRLRDERAERALAVPGDFERQYQWMGNTYAQ